MGRFIQVFRSGASALGVNRVARELGIKPPAIYKHLQGNTELNKVVALKIYELLFAELRSKTAGIKEPRALLKAGGFTSRDFARLHPGLFQVMMQFQLQPEDPDSAAIIQESQGLFKALLDSQSLSKTKLIDIMRMINSAIFGFISLERSGLLTLPRSTDDSFAVMLDEGAIVHAVEVIPR